MKKSKLAFLLMIILFGMFSANQALGSAANPKVTICHATASHSNPYITNNPDANSNVGGHDGHDGPVFPSVDASGNWGDIIPSFFYDDKGVTLFYPGKNLTAAGLAILNNNCNYPAPSPSPTTTPSPSPSASVSPSPSPTPSLSPTPTPTASPTPSASPSATPTPTPSPTSSSSSSASSGGPSDPSNNSTSSSQGSVGEVLGTSTLAETGSTQDLMTLLFGLGIVFIALSLSSYAQAKAN